jgi:hypothetical protein
MQASEDTKPSLFRNFTTKLLKDSPFARDAATGACVGFTDIVCVYPLAVLATRRECGATLKDAISQGRFWAGGWTAGTLLVPYSIAVESLSRSMQRLLVVTPILCLSHTSVCLCVYACIRLVISLSSNF